MLFEPADDAGRGIQPKRTAACEQHRMYLVDQIGWVEQICLTRPGCRAADVDTADRARLGQNHGAAGRAAGIGEMPDADAGHIGDGAA